MLVVPESRAPGSDPEKTLDLPVAVIASRSDEPAADPLVFPTAGGPGSSTFGALWYALDYADWAADGRDIILVEQRGDAQADPSLDCPELDTEHRIVDGVWLTGSAADDLRRELTAKCYARLVEEGNNLAGYTSAESAADLVDLRKALGYDAWNLYGVSYGSRLALTMMRDHPEGLRSVILDGTLPLNVNRHELMPAGFRTALDNMLAACAADANCEEEYPDLEATLARLLDTVADKPLSVTVKDPSDGSDVRLDLHDTDVAAGLFDALYDARLVPILPFVIDQLSRGNLDSALPLAQSSVDSADYSTEGLYLSVECAEEAPFNDPEAIAAAGEDDPILEHFVDPGGLPGDCEVWDVPALSAIENQAVASRIPALLTVGGYDPVTPLAFSEKAAAGLAWHYLYAFPTMAHGAVWQNWIDDCPASIAQQFLNDPRSEPDSSCIAAMPPTDFLTTSDIYPTSAIYRFNTDVVQSGKPVQVGIPSIILVLLIATLVYSVVYGLSWLFRRRGGAPAGAVPVAATAAVLYLAYAGALALVIVNTDPLILGFGVPVAARPLIIALLLAIAVTILLVVVTVRAWVVADGTTFHRVALSVASAASVAMAVWLIFRGLLFL
ncbi:hypothetical protein GCM10009777_16190 [Microbacterium pumilum]|uniref:AB hydrolase-1 domain-containing protein n=1 Tax=Microbacterium pumilum TaxID=344165 RepID=A0ABP5DR54_9MICO